MTRILFSLVFILVLGLGAFGQRTETFDLVTFQPPAGWKKELKNGGLVYSIAGQDTYAMIIVTQSQAGSGNAKEDFDTDWANVASGLEAVTPAKVDPTIIDGRWILTRGYAKFTDEIGEGIVIVGTYSASGRKMSLVALFNSEQYLPAIQAFAASVSIANPGSASPAKPAAPAATTAILGTWGQNNGAHITYGDPVSASMAGYSKDQYTFKADGTYSFASKTFRMSYEKIILVIENGTYQVNGDELSIRPQKSVVQAWSKLNGGDGWGRMISNQARKLEPVTYKFRKHYFSGIDEWNLVLQSNVPTQRDGPYSTLTLFPNAWYYKPISSNNPAIVLPR